MGLGTSILVVAVLILAAFQSWKRAVFEEDQGPTRRWLWEWAAQGMAAPLLVWVGLNIGISSRLPPLMPQVALVQAAGGPWIATLLDVTGSGVWVIGSFWAGMTFGWLLAWIAVRIPASLRADFNGIAVFWGALLLPVVYGILHWVGWWASGLAAVVWFWPIVHFTTDLVHHPKAVPVYARAVARLKFGKFNEAEWEILRELETFEDDFEGWLMLAELYAVHFHDLAVAEQTIHDVCQQPNLNGSQIAVALHRLADWHLKLGDDPVAARQALERICERLPGTHLERMACQRIDRLPATRAAWREQQQGRRIRLPARTANDGEAADPAAPAPTRSEATAQANRFVEQLRRNPNDTAAREQLARLLAEPLGQTDQAIEQLELLLGMPDPRPPRAAEWLSLLAAWHLRYRRDPAVGRRFLEQLVRDYPQSAQAFAAQRRLSLMNVEQQFRQARMAAPPGKGPNVAGETE